MTEKHMKTHIRILTVAAALCVGLFTATAADKDGHNHKVTPKGGRLLEKTEPHAEFVVEKDRSVTINFYNEEMKPVAATTQSGTVIADAKGGKATLQFEKKGDTLVSKTKLPDGDGANVLKKLKEGDPDGLVIPLTLVAIHFAIAPLSGSSVNPARSIGSAVVGGDLGSLWIYLVGPIVGGAIRWGMFKAMGRMGAPAA